MWSDEFNSPVGTLPDPKNWNYDLGGGGWGNGEEETYTNSPSNIFQDGKGHLVVRAIRDAAGNYTSARLQTGAPGASTQTAELSWKYGRIEARIQLPFGQGVWPAFWILGENIGSVGWPACGEVDIMENFGTYNNDVSTSNGNREFAETGGSHKAPGIWKRGPLQIPFGRVRGMRGRRNFPVVIFVVFLRLLRLPAVSDRRPFREGIRPAGVPFPRISNFDGTGPLPE